MKFGWINIFGAIIVILMLIPNIVYAIKNKGEKNLCTNRFMNVIEQIGRYSCMKRRSVPLALVLAILPACIFLLSGILLRHWLLVGFAVLFAVGHIYVTYHNAAHARDRN